ncbi:M24 family metallopeptidase [Miltoncostaea marina]|uniref:M24 family metallopeptidase n=1 Tax=Miltoncostaea marina TaxID=2843215 RepID=UPI001C3C92DA|nr:Xaa-Pro peptidase family protein [Miltoncostaea marina]
MSAEAARQERLLAVLDERGIDAMLVTGGANVRYLTGYVGSNGIAVIGRRGRLLLTDSRYAVSAREQVRDAEVVVGSRDLLKDVAERLAEVAGGGRIAVEAEDLTIARHERLLELLDGAPTEPTRGIVEALRMVKDAGEVAAMRRAAAAVDRALARVLAAGIVGRTERAVAFALHEAMLEEGATEPSFATIVAAGPNGARPHHVPGADAIPAGTLVVIDLGAVVDGYCSDMTRTVATGPLPERLEEAYGVCLAAQEAALAAARPGMTGAELDAVARGRIADAGHGDHFGHGLGHGVGLEIHERPGIRPEGADVLAAGMAITIEPGVYLEGLGGVRIEDLVVLTEDGREVLSTSPKQLTTVE